MDALIRAIAQKGPEPQTAPVAEKAAVKGRKSRAAICVLPFMNMSGDPEQEYFSDGITEDIITDLSKVSALSVVARNTAFTFKGHTVDVNENVYTRTSIQLRREAVNALESSLMDFNRTTTEGGSLQVVEEYGAGDGIRTHDSLLGS